MKSARLALALAAFRDRGTPDTRQEILAALADCELLFAVAERGPGDRGIRLAYAKDGQGRLVVPGFTDAQHLRAWLRVASGSATAPAAGFLPAVLSGPFAGLVLDPNSDASTFIDRHALERLFAGEDPRSATTAKDGETLVQRVASTERCK